MFNRNKRKDVSVKHAYKNVSLRNAFAHADVFFTDLFYRNAAKNVSTSNDVSNDEGNACNCMLRCVFKKCIYVDA
jgi:hypothetical protein